MKLNWGNWIAIVYIVFVLFIGTMVYLTFGEKWDLVSEDYYEQEIKYQDKIDSRANANQKEVKPAIFIAEKNLNITIPHNVDDASDINGTVEFFRPSDASKDLSVDIVSESEVKVPLSLFSKGKYLAKISWTANGTKYYHEKTLIIP